MRSRLRDVGAEFRQLDYASLAELRTDVEKRTCRANLEIVGDMTFVGCIDRELALVQHKTSLLMANSRVLSEELFYQICVFNFGNFGYWRLSEPLNVERLALMALDDPLTEWTPDDGAKDVLARRCAKFLYTKATMLDDFFSIQISKRQMPGDNDDAGGAAGVEIVLESLPMLMDGYEPNLVDLPLFVIRMATEVDWDDEKRCFDSLSNEIAMFYSIKNLIDSTRAASAPPTATPVTSKEPNSSSSSGPDAFWTIEHVLYKAFRHLLLPSRTNEHRSYFKLVDLPRLYKVFERC